LRCRDSLLGSHVPFWQEFGTHGCLEMARDYRFRSMGVNKIVRVVAGAVTATGIVMLVVGVIAISTRLATPRPLATIWAGH
jgi:hypothetical protein